MGFPATNIITMGVSHPIPHQNPHLEVLLKWCRRDVVDKMGFQTMTPVQAGTIPRAMKHQDCVVEVSPT